MKAGTGPAKNKGKTMQLPKWSERQWGEGFGWTGILVLIIGVGIFVNQSLNTEGVYHPGVLVRVLIGGGGALLLLGILYATGGSSSVSTPQENN